MGNWKIENRTQGQFAFCGFGHFACEVFFLSLYWQLFICIVQIWIQPAKDP